MHLHLRCRVVLLVAGLQHNTAQPDIRQQGLMFHHHQSRMTPFECMQGHRQCSSCLVSQSGLDLSTFSM